VIASDYDGTLSDYYNNFVIQEEIANFLNEFSLRYPLIIVSGREEKYIFNLARSLKPMGWVLENGTVFVYKGMRFLNVDENWFKIRERIVRELYNNNINFSLGKVIIYIDNALNYKNIIERINDGKVVWNRNNAMIVPKNINKGLGLKKFLEKFNIKGKIVAIGDGENDLDLFSVADVRVAVLNAVEILKKNADIILDEPNGKGVIKFLKGLLS
jgi:phosphoglycolate phosphatase (TIGR01487 family)